MNRQERLLDHDITTPTPFSIAHMVIEGGRDTCFEFLGGATRGKPPRRHGQSMHKHSHYEIIYVARGEMTQHLENGVFRYQPGDACFLNRNTHHYEGFETDCELFFINLTPDFVDRLLGRNDILPDMPQYQRGEIQRFLIQNNRQDAGLEREYLDFACTMEQRLDAAPPPASRLLDEIALEISCVQVGYAFRVQALLLRFFAELEDAGHYHLSHIRIDASSEAFVFARLLRYLQERHGRVSRKELGAVLHYNGDYLNRIAKRQCGKTLLQLGRRIAVEEACRMLAETDCSVACIIERLGWSNHTHFYRMFQAEKACSPLAYRRLMQGEKNGST